MAKKIVNVVYKVDSKELDAVKKSLQANQQEAKKFDDNLKKVDKTAKDAGSNASKSFMDFKNILGTISFVGILSGLTSLGKKIFDLGVQQEQLNIAFTTFLGSAEKAKKLMAELTKFSIITPFTPDQVNKAAKTLLAFGTQAKDIIPTLKMLGDVSSGTGKDLSEMAVIFGQIQSTGRLMGQDLLQLINAGFNPLQIISEKTGKSVKVLKEEMEKGLISFDMVKQAFKDATSEGGLFFNLMEKQSASVGGKLSTVQGNIEEIEKALFKSNSGALKVWVDLLVKGSEKMLELTEPLEDRFKRISKTFGEESEQFKKVLQDVFYELGPEGVERLRREVKAELATPSVTEDLQQSLNLLNEFIRLKEIQIDQLRKERSIRLKSGDNATDILNRIELVKLELQLAKSRVAGINIPDPKKKFKDNQHDSANYGPNFIKDFMSEDLVGLVPNPDLLEEYTKKAFDIFEENLKKEQELQNQAYQDDAKAFWENEDKKKAIRQQNFDFAVGLLGTLLVASMTSNKEDLAAIDEKYSRELELAGNNENAKKSIERKRDQERKEAMRRQEQDERKHRVNVILAETLVNAVKALGLPPIPGANFIAAAQAVAFGALQAGLVGKYKEGGWITGPGTPTSDSVPIMASRDEFMVNAAAAAQSPNLLEAINERKINDNILRAVASTGGRQVNMMDDSRIVKAIEENRVDYINQGYTLMKIEKSGSNFKRYIRAKVQGYK